jgi:predicted PurR-regulated permease PerM
MAPSDDRLEKVRDEVVRFAGCLAMVACGYVVVVSLALWALGVPQPLLWGLMAGLFEVVAYFGPLIASVLPTVVALSLGVWWKPVAVAGLFLALHLVEGYLITPALYGRAVRFDPVTVLFGALFFGWLWGPVGLAVAMPMLIILRGLLLITPNTPALDALADVEGEKERTPGPKPLRAL